MNLSKELLDIIVCPETHQPLKPVEAGQLQKIRELIAGQKLKNRLGELVTGEISGALIREKGDLVYLVRDNIPVLLVDEAVALPS